MGDVDGVSDEAQEEKGHSPRPGSPHLGMRSERPARRAASMKRAASEESSEARKLANNGAGQKRRAGQSRRKEEEEIWVQCDKCSKWRCLTTEVDFKSLAKRKWDCTMNKDQTRNTCEAPEEEFKTTKREEASRNYLGHWMKRVETTDENEQKLPKEILRPKIRGPNETEWIRCSNPLCGKWRSVSPLVDTKVLQRRGLWFCVLNTWDPHLASCVAPQEISEHE